MTLSLPQKVNPLAGLLDLIPTHDCFWGMPPQRRAVETKDAPALAMSSGARAMVLQGCRQQCVTFATIPSAAKTRIIQYLSFSWGR
jgi:hypothetical protein